MLLIRRLGNEHFNIIVQTRTMKNLNCYFSLILLLLGCADNLNRVVLHDLEYSHYEIQLKINPGEQFIKVNGSLKLLIEKDSVDELSFNLHEQFVINNFSVDGDNSYQLDTTSERIRWLPNAVQILYLTKKPYNSGDILNIKFSYGGEDNKMAFLEC
jgi:hypothetical protein